MTEQLAGLTPVSLHSAIGQLHRRVLQNLAKEQGIKANQKSEALVSSLFERFAAGLNEIAGDGAGSTAGVAGGEEAPVPEEALSPVGNRARYSAEGETDQRDGTTARSMPAASPLPGSLEGAVNPLFFMGGQEGQEQEGQKQQVEQEGQKEQVEQGGRQQRAAATLPASVEQGGTAAAAAGSTRPANKRPQAGGKRKAEEAPQEGPPPAAKRQARNDGGSAVAEQTGTGDQENKAGSTKAAAASAAGSAALRATNSAGAAGLKAAPGKGGVPAALPKARPSTSGANLSVMERARRAEEAHAARRAAGLAKAGQRGRM